MGIGLLCCSPHLFLRSLRVTVADVISDGPGEQHWLLTHIPDQRPEPADIQVPHIPTFKYAFIDVFTLNYSDMLNNVDCAVFNNMCKKVKKEVSESFHAVLLLADNNNEMNRKKLVIEH